MDESLFVLLLLSGLSWVSSALSRQYRYINLSMSWPEAQSYCRERFTDLATVDTVDDVNELINIVDAGYSGSVWIGLNRGTEKHWAWSNGEDTLAQYNDWGPGEPGSEHDCVVFGDYWVTKKCSDIYNVLCSSKKSGLAIVGVKQDWKSAQKICRELDSDIATIHNTDEKNVAYKLMMSQGKPAWIGLFRESWEWSDKWSSFFKNWAADQPSQSAGSSDCVSMSTTDSGKWANENCNLRHPFICHGDEKYVRKQTVRLKLSCNGTCSLNDPSLQTAVLKQINEKLKSMGLESKSKINWIKREDEKVIHQESNHTANSDNECNIP